MCDHNTSVVIYSGLETEVELCEWGCDKILIYKRMPNGNMVLVREVDNPLRARVEELEAGLKKIANMKNYKLKQGETIHEAFYKCHAVAQKALDKVSTEC